MKRLLQITMAAMLAAACTGDDNEPVRQGTILFGRTSAGIEWLDGRSATRSGELIDSDTPDDIGVFAFGSGQNTTYVFRNQRVYWMEGAEYDPQTDFSWDYVALSHWPYTIEEPSSKQQPWDKMKYRFFAYSPWYETKHVSVTAENYIGFNSFTWDNVPGFTKHDFMLSNNIIDIDNTAGVKKTADVVTFQMRHILSRIRFFFKMSEHYRHLRKIELNSITILTAGKVKSATFNFNNTLEWDETVHWSNEQTGDADPVTLVNASTDCAIPVDYPDDPFASVYVYPQDGFKEIKMTLNYNVYDSKGIVTREAEITNKIEIKGPEGNGWNLLSGYYYDIKINIEPDYLYVLSDNDQDFDGWVIIKDSKLD